LSLLVDDTSPIELLKGRTDSAAILFFDIRGFSSAAEKMQPQDLLQALNDHLQLITQVWSRADAGLVIKDRKRILTSSRASSTH
jgi:class 3 adenylate cyclase